jgi:hypothetical protein
VQQQQQLETIFSCQPGSCCWVTGSCGVCFQMGLRDGFDREGVTCCTQAHEVTGSASMIRVAGSDSQECCAEPVLTQLVDRARHRTGCMTSVKLPGWKRETQHGSFRPERNNRRAHLCFR